MAVNDGSFTNSSFYDVALDVVPSFIGDTTLDGVVAAGALCACGVTREVLGYQLITVHSGWVGDHDAIRFFLGDRLDTCDGAIVSPLKLHGDADCIVPV